MKVAIIGAGICGLYLGWKLAEKGEEVVVFEKKAKIGKEVCSGLFSEKILNFIPESQKLIKNRVEYCLINFPKKTLKIKFSEKFLVMSHFELDNLVADLAKKSGAKIILNHEVKREEISVLKEKFDRIIGCDGPNSAIRKYLKMKELNFCLAIQGFLRKENFSDTENTGHVETWATPNNPALFEKREGYTGQAKNGFIWRIPRGKEVEYGIMERSEAAKNLFDDFLEKKNLQLAGINSALIHKGLLLPHNPKFTLCGDAAGLTKPWSGGGVIWGLTAGEILLKNFPDFLKYQKETKRFFLPKIILSKIAKKIVYFLGFNFPWFLPNNFKIESDFLF